MSGERPVKRYPEPSARFMVAAGGLESGLNTAVNAVPLAEMVGGE